LVVPPAVAVAIVATVAAALRHRGRCRSWLALRELQ
jgi:hypothetical protein